jgi:hypothetical protein
MDRDRMTDILPREFGAHLARVDGSIPQRTRAVLRPSLDREERLIKEMLLRMTSLIEERIELTIEALEDDCDAGARRSRPAVPADAGPHRVRAGTDRRLRRERGKAGP